MKRVAHHKKKTAYVSEVVPETPKHLVAKILSPSRYWLSRKVSSPSFGFSNTFMVECKCGKAFYGKEFAAHLEKHGMTVRHHLGATVHYLLGTKYACACGELFCSFEGLAEHISEAQELESEAITEGFADLNDTLLSVIQ
ncbi:hypothetical protein IHQ75_04325 [Bifidobacterium dentium]|uniref:hypothetical protein n=1 Tax=Bifidobacterium dentium TaxID=1689 RepID=UPI0018C2BAA3|nr:hypothetical protein [Bifidobacterium dentium]MBF9710194.1 hypothetical protein [Bifidobacterium dentium]